MSTTAIRKKIARLVGGSAPRVLDLFAGCGGLSLGFQGAGYRVLAGVEEVATLLRDLPVTVRAFPEGAIFGGMQPVLTIEGRYVDYAQYETALLGLVCQASGVATKAARCKKAAGERPVVSFGARRMHPALAPMIERNAYLGGCDGVAVAVRVRLSRRLARVGTGSRLPGR